MAPTDSFKVPIKKLELKEAPASERKPWWMAQDGTVYHEPQFKKIPLNPDVHIIDEDFIDE